MLWVQGPDGAIYERRKPILDRRQQGDVRATINSPTSLELGRSAVRRCILEQSDGRAVDGCRVDSRFLFAGRGDAFPFKFAGKNKRDQNGVLPCVRSMHQRLRLLHRILQGRPGDRLL